MLAWLMQYFFKSSQAKFIVIRCPENYDTIWGFKIILTRCRGHISTSRRPVGRLLAEVAPVPLGHPLLLPAVVVGVEHHASLLALARLILAPLGESLLAHCVALGVDQATLAHIQEACK